MADTRLGIIIEAQDRASRVVADVGSRVEGLHGKLMRAEDASQKFAMGIGAAGAAMAGVLGYGVKVAADLQTARMGLVTLLGSTEEADATIARLKVEAARTPFELPGLTQATQLLSSVTKNGDKAIDVLLDIGEGLAAMGKGQAELDRIIVNLQQIAAVGKATSIDIKQFAFAGIPIFEMLQEKTGLAGDALADFIEGGGVTFDMLTQMFDEANDAGGRFFNAYINQTGTFNQSWSNLKDTVGVFLAELVTSTGIFDGVVSAMNRLTGFLQAHQEQIKNTVLWLVQHKEVLYIVAGAIVGALVPAIYAAAVAFGTLMLTLAPFMLAGAAIVGLILGIKWLVDNWDMLKAKALEIWGVVADWIGEKINAVTGFIGAGLETIKGAWMAVWQFLLEFTKNIVGFIVGVPVAYLDFFFPQWEQKLRMVVDKAVELWTQFKDWLAALWGIITENTLAALEMLYGIIVPAIEKIKEVWNAVWGAVGDFFKTIWDAIKETVRESVDWIMDKIQPAIDMAMKLIDLVKNLGKTAGKAGSTSLDFLSSGVSSLISRGRKVSNVDDAIITPQGNIIRTNPNDWLFATKNPAGMGASLVITGNTFLDERAAEKFGDILVKRLMFDKRISLQ